VRVRVRVRVRFTHHLQVADDGPEWVRVDSRSPPTGGCVPHAAPPHPRSQVPLTRGSSTHSVPCLSQCSPALPSPLQPQPCPPQYSPSPALPSAAPALPSPAQHPLEALLEHDGGHAQARVARDMELPKGEPADVSRDELKVVVGHVQALRVGVSARGQLDGGAARQCCLQVVSSSTCSAVPSTLRVAALPLWAHTPCEHTAGCPIRAGARLAWAKNGASLVAAAWRPASHVHPLLGPPCLYSPICLEGISHQCNGMGSHCCLVI